MSADAYVYVNYARHDVSFVSKLTDDLRRHGIETWRDLEQIEPGVDWVDALNRGIDGADAQLYVVSDASIKSPWVDMALKRFVSRSLPVVPIIIDDVGSEWLSSIEAGEWVDFREDYDGALRRLVEALPTSVRHEAPVESTPETTKGYVFLSYAEEDAAFAHSLRAFLAERKYAYWDYNESDRDYHTQLFTELESVIVEASATLSIISPEWKRSTWTIREYLFSEEVDVPVFLLRAKAMPPSLAIAGVPYIDFVRDRNDGLRQLDRELRRAGL